MSHDVIEGPRCPSCRGCFGCPGPSPLDLVCGACGYLWVGTQDEYDVACECEAAWEQHEQAEAVAERARWSAARDRARARRLFIDAGKPVPAWLDEAVRGGGEGEVG